MELVRYFSLFFRIVRIESSRYAHYPFEFISAIFNRFTGLLILVLFWYVVATNSDGDLDVRYLMSYFLVVGGIVQFSNSNMTVAASMLKKIKFGSLNAYLVRPIGAFYFEYARNTGFFIHFYFISILLIVAGMMLGGTSINTLVVIPTFVSMMLINTAFNMILACAGFYLVETSGVKNAVKHTLHLLQGNLIPISLMPLALQQILGYTPFPASLYLPVIALLGQPVTLWQIVTGLIWGVALMILARKFWTYSLRKYEATGI